MTVPPLGRRRAVLTRRRACPPRRPSAASAAPEDSHAHAPPHRRRQADVRGVRRARALIKVRPVAGDPPEAYHVEYPVRGLERGQAATSPSRASTTSSRSG